MKGDMAEEQQSSGITAAQQYISDLIGGMSMGIRYDDYRVVHSQTAIIPNDKDFWITYNTQDAIFSVHVVMDRSQGSDVENAVKIDSDVKESSEGKDYLEMRLTIRNRKGRWILSNVPIYRVKGVDFVMSLVGDESFKRHTVFTFVISVAESKDEEEDDE